MLREIYDFNSFLVVSEPDGAVTTTLPSRKRGSTDGSQAGPVPLPQASRERGQNINLVLSAPQKAPFCNEMRDLQPKYLPRHQAGPPGIVFCHDKRSEGPLGFINMCKITGDPNIIFRAGDETQITPKTVLWMKQICVSLGMDGLGAESCEAFSVSKLELDIFPLKKPNLIKRLTFNQLLLLQNSLWSRSRMYKILSGVPVNT